jgi:hypothetical protein
MVPALELKMNTNSKELGPIMPPTERKNLPLHTRIHLFYFLLHSNKKSYNEKKIMIAWKFC